MPGRTVRIIGVTVIIAFYVGVEHYLLSGTYPGFRNTLRGIILSLFVYGIYLVIREPNRKQKMIQIVILLCGITLGILGAIAISNSVENHFPRRYYINEVQ